MYRQAISLKVLRLVLAPLLCLVFCAGLSFAGASARPSEVVRSGTDRALELLRGSCQPGQPFVFREHRDEILKIAYEYFDFTEMAMRALGPPWKNQPAAKQQEFVRLFEQLIFSTYIDRVDSYTCADEKVIYESEAIEGNSAVVKTRVTGFRGQEIAIEYRLRLKDGEWKAYDVSVEGVSLVNNYRQQFSAILAKQSFDDLLRRIREKLAAPN